MDNVYYNLNLYFDLPFSLSIFIQEKRLNEFLHPDLGIRLQILNVATPLLSVILITLGLPNSLIQGKINILKRCTATEIHLNLDNCTYFLVPPKKNDTLKKNNFV